MIFRGKRPVTADKARVILLSKTGSRSVDPADTRLITVQPLTMRIIDKTALMLGQDKLWSNIGSYQHGFRRHHSTIEHITSILDTLKVGVKGRKQNKILIFVDFAKAFDSVDRNLLIKIHPDYIKDGYVRSLIKEILQPQQIHINHKYSFQASKESHRA